MKNTKFVHDIACPFCKCMSLKLIPTDSTFTVYEETSCMCTECGRPSVNIIKLEQEKEVA